MAFLDTDINLGESNYDEEEISFRGSIYSDLVFQITGWSFYSAWTPPARVKEMYAALMNCDPEEEIRRYNYNVSLKLSVENIMELRKFFRVCAERDFGLIGC